MSSAASKASEYETWYAGAALTSRATAASGRGSIAHSALDCSPRTNAARARLTGVTSTPLAPAS